ncbi:response regulator transcription factor [Spongiibacter nanhainus]|uniref:Response regulator transcription factor n=1 Tax=Spongiibacter nanhainus TaxID=2794344 RepID=A0A7T4R1Q4_9GAMM|nr:response regulator transcription factor [Spongiibacter nanhainus]QQD18642.1 response regulator transcription factor [Spongiibacter nanhainus]
MATILLVEDEHKLASFLLRGLGAEGYDCDWIDSSERFLSEIGSPQYELILLDRLVQDIDTLDYLPLVKKKQPKAMILMLTALQDVDQKVIGLQAGADDYLGKPFDFDELLARVTALLRRGGHQHGPIQQLSRGHLALNTDSHRVWLNQREVELTHLEYQLLKCFLSNPDSVLSRERILNKVWGSLADPLTNIVDVYIRRVRKKLSEASEAQQLDCHNESFIETVRGSGYRLGRGK